MSTIHIRQKIREKQEWNYIKLSFFNFINSFMRRGVWMKLKNTWTKLIFLTLILAFLFWLPIPGIRTSSEAGNLIYWFLVAFLNTLVLGYMIVPKLFVEGFIVAAVFSPIAVVVHGKSHKKSALCGSPFIELLIWVA
ncbi:hypothetical protein DRN39_08145, partial [Thermococci archaeon]